MYDSYKKLQYKSKTSEDYKETLNKRISNLVEIPLLGKDTQYLKILNPNVPYMKLLIHQINEEYNEVNIATKTNYIEEEAFSTCVIEGARTTIADTLRIAKGSTPRNKSEQMVFNSIRGINLIKSLDLKSWNIEQGILDIWRIITTNAMDNSELCGNKYRAGQVYVLDAFQKIRFTPPAYTEIQWRMDSLFDFIKNTEIHPLIAAIIVHYYFVYIHPFCDGNGRMARLLITQYLVKNGYDKFGYISLTTEVFKNSKGYYESLENSENAYNDITFFILYYLGIMYKALINANKGFGAKLEDTQDNLNKRQVKCVRYLKENPANFITQTKYCDVYKVIKPIAQKELNELVDYRLLHKEKHVNMIYKWWEFEI